MRRVRTVLFVPILCLLAATMAGAQPPVPPPAGGGTAASAWTQDVGPGFCVVIGNAEVDLSLALAQDERRLVQELANTPDRVEPLRKAMRDAGLAPRAMAMASDWKSLPYADSIVNAIVVPDYAAARAAGLGPEEVLRVLAPGGVALLGVAAGYAPSEWKDRSEVAKCEMAGNRCRVLRAAIPGLDEWPQFEHDGGRTGISSDARAGLPHGIRWMDGERWPPYATFAVENPGFASAGGRHFVWDAIGLKGTKKSRLFCRDAWNGLPLWEREFDRPPKANMLAADGDHILLHLGAKNLLVLDAATGQTRQTFDQAATCEMMLHDGGRIFEYDRAGRLGVMDAATGRVLWEKRYAADNDWYRAGDRVVVNANGVFLAYRAEKGSPLRLACLDPATGAARWDMLPQGLELGGAPQATYNLVSVSGDNLLVSNASRNFQLQKDAPAKPYANYVLATSDGHLQGHYEFAPTGHGGRATSAFLIGGLMWAKTSEAWVGWDPATGAEQRRTKGKANSQCYPDHAVRNIVLSGQMNFTDLESGTEVVFEAARSACGSGFFPANGLVYTLPTRCHCFPLVRGYLGLAPESALTGEPTPEAARLEKGPAFVTEPGPEIAKGWTTLRGDSRRSGAIDDALPERLALAWQTPPGAALTPPVAANWLVVAARTETREVLAFNATDGAPRWTHFAGGRIESPPTLWRGRVIFGADDGTITCLNAKDGALVWRLR